MWLTIVSSFCNKNANTEYVFHGIGSTQELSDLKSSYVKYGGDMNSLMANTLLCGGEEDQVRYKRILRELVDSKQLPVFEAFEQETAKKRTYRKQVGQ